MLLIVVAIRPDWLLPESRRGIFIRYRYLLLALGVIYLIANTVGLIQAYR